MPQPALEVVDTFVTNAAAITATGVYSGDVLAVRNFNPPNTAFMADAWALSATAGIARYRSPRLHDNVQGIRFRFPTSAAARSLFTEYDLQPLYAQDTIIVEAQGGAAETSGASYLVYYQDLPGTAARLTTFGAIASRIVNLVNVEVANTSGAAVGARSASAALNSTFDLLIANTDYAVLGMESDTAGQTMSFRGIDTGNVRIGCPMTTERIETRDFFVRLGKRLGQGGQELPCIPILNSANKAGILIDNCQVVVGLAANITLVLAQLHP